MPDTYWTFSTWLTYEVPHILLKNGPTAVRAGGRALGNLNPMIEGIGWVASVGPNLADHLLSGDSGTEIATDMIVDTGGWGLSMGGATALTFLGGLVGTAEPGGGTAVGAASGNLAGSLGTSVGYDVFIAPRVRPYVRKVIGFNMGQ